jgi:RimJ/RimL family protein N-acetyltransferase
VATRGLKLFVAWAFESLGLQRVELLAEVDNLPSQRVAERYGFAREGLLRAKIKTRRGRSDAYLYSLLPSD